MDASIEWSECGGRMEGGREGWMLPFFYLGTHLGESKRTIETGDLSLACPTGHLQSACARIAPRLVLCKNSEPRYGDGRMARSRRGAEGLEARKLGRRRRWATSCRGHCVLRVSSAGATQRRREGRAMEGVEGAAGYGKGGRTREAEQW